MSMELNMSASLCGDLEPRPRNRDERGVSRVYGELLRSACSLEEILGAAGRGQSKSRRGGAPPVERPRAGCDAVVARINFGIAAADEGLPEPEFRIPKSADGPLSTGGGIPGRSGILERFRPGRLPNLAKGIAFAVLCTVLIGASAIAVFSSMRGDRDRAPTTSRVQPEAPAAIEAAAAAAIVAFPVPVPAVVQPLPAPPTAAAETVPRPDTAQRHDVEPPGAMPRREGAAIAKTPADKMPATPPSRAHIAGKHKASAPRRYVEASRRARGQTPARYPQPVYNGQQPGSYNTDFDRGYGYGGPAAYSDTGG